MAETDLKNAYATLPRRHRRFVDEYLTGKKGTEAIAAIGFKGRRPDLAASKFLARPAVRAAIEERRAVLCEAVGLRQEAVLRELMAVGLSDPRQLFDEAGNLKRIIDLDPTAAAMIASIDVEDKTKKVRLWDKPAALNQLAEIVGLKKTAAVQHALGPGLQVILQQNIAAGGQGDGPALGVIVNLPGPG